MHLISLELVFGAKVLGLIYRAIEGHLIKTRG